MELNNQATRALHAKNYESALASIDQAISIEPEFCGAYVNKAAILTAMGRDVNAIAALEAAINKMPDYVDAYVPLGLLLERMGNEDAAQIQYKKALELYDRALARNPDDAGRAVDRAIATYLAGDARKALLALKEVLETHPDHEKAQIIKQRIEKENRRDFISGLEPK